MTVSGSRVDSGGRTATAITAIDPGNALAPGRDFDANGRHQQGDQRVARAGTDQ